MFPSWHDLQVSISSFGKRFVGRGSDPDANTALGKAVCEAVERATCFRHGISSLGVAGHLSMELAKANARLEYVERFCFGRQISDGFKPEDLPPPDRIRERYEQRGIALALRRLVSPKETPVVLCLASGERATPSFGGILGLGAASSIEAASQKALMECLRSLEFYLHATPASLSYEKFRMIESPQAQDRQALLRDCVYFQTLMACLNRKAPGTLKVMEGKFESLSVDSVFAGCPLTFVRYSTPTPLIQPEFLA